jgi:anti-sigma-K factor RskA
MNTPDPLNHPAPPPFPLDLSSAAGSTRGTHDLFELASLDALGLLDDGERREFEARFAAAPAALKAQLRAQQGLVVSLEDTLPEVSPPSSLRARVLAAVAGAISATRLHEAARVVPAILPSKGVNRGWRAAAIGAAAAAVVFGITTLQMQSQYREIDQAFQTNAATDYFVRNFGPRFEQLLLTPRTQTVRFSPVVATATNAPAPMAVLLVDPVTKVGQFLARDLPATSGSFNLVIVDRDGQTVGTPVLNFRPTASRVVATIENLDLPDGSSYAVQMITADGVQTLLRGETL